MDDGLQYRQILGGLAQVRGDLRSRRPQPEVIVKLDVSDDDAKVIRELLGTPNLEFKVTAIDSPNGVDINMHIRLKQPTSGTPFDVAAGIDPLAIPPNRL